MFRKKQKYQSPFKGRPNATDILEVRDKAKRENYDNLTESGRNKLIQKRQNTIYTAVAFILLAGGMAYCGIEQHNQNNQTQPATEPLSICEKYPDACREYY